MSDDLIMRMAQKFYESSTSAFPEAPPWESLDASQRNDLYDGLWHALHLLKEPTDEMVQAVFVGDIDHADQVWKEMINKLLEVKNP